MTRNLKALGLALLAAFALSAVAAAGAQAEVFFHDEAASSTIVGEDISNPVFAFEAGTIECKTEGLDGVMTGTTEAEVVLVPSFKECESASLGIATFDINGCQLGLLVIGPPISGELRLLCPANKQVEITVPACTIDIKPQVLGKISYANKGMGKKRDVEKTTEVNLTYTQTGVFCPGNGFAKEKTFTKGIYKDVVTLAAKTGGGGEEGLWVE
jgi:hypothetical protein